MPKPYNRIDRLSEELAHNTTEFLHERLSEKYGIVTCTKVDLSHNLQSAKIWLSFYPQLEDDKDVNDAIRPYMSDLIGYLKKRVPMKYIPQFTFAVDHGDENADRIEKLMDKI